MTGGNCIVDCKSSPDTIRCNCRCGSYNISTMCCRTYDFPRRTNANVNCGMDHSNTRFFPYRSFYSADGFMCDLSYALRIGATYENYQGNQWNGGSAGPAGHSGNFPQIQTGTGVCAPRATTYWAFVEK